MNFSTAVITCFRKVFDFSGRASRPEFWWFVFFLGAANSYLALIIYALLGLLGVLGLLLSFALPDIVAGMIFVVGAVLVFLAWFFLYIAAAARRLHDIGLSGWWQLLPLGSLLLLLVNVIVCVVFLISSIVWLYFSLAKKSEPKANKYGPPLGKNGLPVTKKRPRKSV